MRQGLLWLLLAGATASASAQQATFKGIVLTDSTERPIPGVTVTIDLLKLSATTDSSGEFTIKGIRPGTHVISARKIGFGPVTTRVTFMTGAIVEADLMMVVTAAQALPDVTVETKALVRGKLAEFEERRLAGNGGRFLTQADLEKRPFSLLADALRQLPGLGIVKSPRGSGQIVTAGRASLPAGAISGGKAVACPSAVVLDGIMVFGAGEQGEAPFDINQINPNHLAGVEYYVGPASMPIKYNGMRHTCGLLVLWTRSK